jgi:hypothetical protein
MRRAQEHPQSQEEGAGATTVTRGGHRSSFRLKRRGHRSSYRHKSRGHRSSHRHRGRPGHETTYIGGGC